MIRSIHELFKSLSTTLAEDKSGLAVMSAPDGKELARIAVDSESSIDKKITVAADIQTAWAALTRGQRVALIEAYSATLKTHREALAALITYEVGKTQKEALGETDSSADMNLKTIKDSSLPEFNGMLRCKERDAVGVVGLITSFNFPLVVAQWTIAPALLAGNAVVWKPSEKTPLVAIACKALFDSVAGNYKDVLQLAVGGREIGTALVTHEKVAMISATGSVPMGKAIRKVLDAKKTNIARPILELGGNNGVIISNRFARDKLDWAVNSLLTSYLGTTGQRCTNTRRLIVHRETHAEMVALFKAKLTAFIASGAIGNPLLGLPNDYEYAVLIDRDAFERFEQSKKQAAAEGGTILFGARLFADQYPNAYYIEPALALMPKQSPVMHTETFAPLLFITTYESGIEEAIALVNAPDNAGLVNGIYTQSRKEAELFAARNGAGHTIINSGKGTGTPAFGMGFGGNKDSGEGEILNTADPLAAFTRNTRFRRIAQNKDIAMDAD